VKRVDLERHLAQHGCVLAREGGRHSVYRNPANERRAAVPRHREIRDLLARQICRQLGIPVP
jgi:predicted RNA binding protein YcfA (HicA-like mRNA interferase family)